MKVFYSSIFLFSLLFTSSVFSKGNGAPVGAHFNLNIIGVSKDKTADMSDNNGRRIFVKLEGKSKINLKEGEDFKVLDANATKGAAEFQLPNPDVDGDGITVYSVYARALGTPGGSSKMTTCADELTIDELTGEEILTEYCSTQSLVSVRSKGKSSFSNVSNELLFMYVDLDGDGVTERYSLFDDALQDYFWDYDNKGLKLLQLRFYPISTDVN